MRLVVVYESMFGATRIVAEAIAGGSTEYDETTVVRANEVGGSVLYDADLVVVGGPTHVRSMSRPSTRKGAPGYAKKHGGGLALEPGADDAPGVREWIDHLGQHTNFAAAFDTRVKGPPPSRVALAKPSTEAWLVTGWPSWPRQRAFSSTRTAACCRAKWPVRPRGAPPSLRPLETDAAPASEGSLPRPRVPRPIVGLHARAMGRRSPWYRWRYSPANGYPRFQAGY